MSSRARGVMLRRGGLVGASALMLVLGACNSGPTGPGSMLGRVSGDGLGGVVMEVQGTGIRGVTARGSVQAYFAAVPGRDNVHRVVLIDVAGGDLGFEIDVDDLGMETPLITLVTATRTDNVIIPVRDLEVTLER